MQLTPSYICLFVSDLARSVAFYQDVLGFEPLSELTTENFKAFRFQEGLVLGLEPNGSSPGREKTKAENAVILQFRAASLEELKDQTEELQERGVLVQDSLQTVSFGTRTSFLDPDGNRLEILYQP